ncbi:hypothetical protein ACFPOI_16810 [Nonomuraea angiospora]|uniref:Uncharacterized protein n=1 Tax=Nonomuraea angiospora TaxID=46172 RepID=A0ABR9MIC9_9ACTN|nr:hypothetical protein [Nonomuraea angiospora]MBE1592300.1 hypothetical protein [Nonomuraea angiospora]
MSAAEVPWTGTWAAAPQQGDASFNQQTIRQIVHTSIGGTSARIQLSNAFGTQSVTIDNVHLARHCACREPHPRTSSRLRIAFEAATRHPGKRAHFAYP